MKTVPSEDIRAYSARELEALGCGVASGIRKAAKRENIKPIIRIFEGNETAYFPFVSLRREWQERIEQAEQAARNAEQYQNGLRLLKEAQKNAQFLPLEDKDYGHLWAYFDRKPDKTKQEAIRKLKAIVAYEGKIASGDPKGKALSEVATDFGEHPNTLRNWLRRIKDVPTHHRLPCLVDGYTGRSAKAYCSPEAWDFIKADWLRRSKPAFAACYDRLKRAAQKHGWTIPNIRTLERRIEKELPREAIILARQGEDALKKCYPPQERDHEVFHAMEAVNGDGYTFWPFVDFGNGVIERPTAWVWQDIFSSRVLTYRVDVSENTEVIRLSAGDMIEKYGIPEHWWLDNTRAAANKTMTGGVANRYRFKVREEDPMGVIPSLGSTPHWCTPGHGQGKPIERIFGKGGTSEYVDKHPAWEGRGTKKRPVPLAEFLGILATEIAAFNARLGRTGRGMNGRSFDQVFEESYARSVVRKATIEQRRLWLLACDNVTCNREDASITIKFYNGPQGQNRYWSEGLSPYAGRKITVRFDPQDLQSTIHCYTLDGRYIGAAQCILATGFNDHDAAREHARQRNKFKKATKQALDAERRMSALQVANLIPPSVAPSPQSVKVVKGTFKKPNQQAVCSDSYEDSFNRAVEQMKTVEQERRKTRI